MITRYGMSEDFDMVALETVTNQYLGGDTSLACSAETQAEIDQQGGRAGEDSSTPRPLKFCLRTVRSWMSWPIISTRRRLSPATSL